MTCIAGPNVIQCVRSPAFLGPLWQSWSQFSQRRQAASTVLFSLPLHTLHQSFSSLTRSYTDSSTNIGPTVQDEWTPVHLGILMPVLSSARCLFRPVAWLDCFLLKWQARTCAILNSTVPTVYYEYGISPAHFRYLCLQYADAAAGALCRSLNHLVIRDIDPGPPPALQEAYEESAVVG